jgi:hypothetical protein
MSLVLGHLGHVKQYHVILLYCLLYSLFFTITTYCIFDSKCPRTLVRGLWKNIEIKTTLSTMMIFHAIGWSKVHLHAQHNIQ